MPEFLSGEALEKHLAELKDNGREELVALTKAEFSRPINSFGPLQKAAKPAGLTKSSVSPDNLLQAVLGQLVDISKQIEEVRSTLNGTQKIALSFGASLLKASCGELIASVGREQKRLVKRA